MVLADPRLVVTEVVEVLHQLQIALNGERGIFAGRVERRQEYTNPQGCHRQRLSAKFLRPRFLAFTKIDMLPLGWRFSRINW